MILLIDGDVLAYQACSPRWEDKAQKQLELDDDGNLITKYIVELDSEGKKVEFNYTAEEDRIYLERSWRQFKKLVRDLIAKLYGTDYMMAVKGENNFRNLLYPEYKLHRHENIRAHTLFVPAIRELAVIEGMAIPAHGREADDLLRIWSEELRRQGKEYCVCTIDKDLRCIPGHHYLLHPHLENNKRRIFIDEEEANRNYFQQFLKGDPTDNIPGIPKIGEVRAAKILSYCHTIEEFQAEVINQYILAYGDAWFEFFLSNAKMIHLQTHPEDYFDCRSWPIVKELLDDELYP